MILPQQPVSYFPKLPTRVTGSLSPMEFWKGIRGTEIAGKQLDKLSLRCYMTGNVCKAHVQQELHEPELKLQPHHTYILRSTT